MHPIDACTDPIPQREAAELVGKSYDTIRRWRRTGVVRGYRSDDGTIYLSRSEVLAVAGAQASAHPGSPLKRARTVRAHGDAQPRAQDDAQGWDRALEAMQKHIATLEAQLSDVTRDRDYQRDRVAILEATVDAKEERIRALEGAEGQVRGLIAEKSMVLDMLTEQEARIVELEREQRRAPGGLRDTLRSRLGL